MLGTGSTGPTPGSPASSTLAWRDARLARDRLTGPPNLFTIGSRCWFTVRVGPALRPGQLDTGAARVVGDVGSMWLPAATIANILVAIPILLYANEGHLPRWLGIGTAVFTVEQLIETITIIGPPGSFIAPGGPMNHYLGGTLTAAFFLAVGIALALPEPSVPEPTVDEPAAD